MENVSIEVGRGGEVVIAEFGLPGESGPGGECGRRRSWGGVVEGCEVRGERVWDDVGG